MSVNPAVETRNGLKGTIYLGDISLCRLLEGDKLLEAERGCRFLISPFLAADLLGLSSSEEEEDPVSKEATKIWQIRSFTLTGPTQKNKWPQTGKHVNSTTI